MRLLSQRGLPCEFPENRVGICDSHSDDLYAARRLTKPPPLLSPSDTNFQLSVARARRSRRRSFVDRVELLEMCRLKYLPREYRLAYATQSRPATNLKSDEDARTDNFHRAIATERKQRATGGSTRGFNAREARSWRPRLGSLSSSYLHFVSRRTCRGCLCASAIRITHQLTPLPLALPTASVLPQSQHGALRKRRILSTEGRAHTELRPFPEKETEPI